MSGTADLSPARPTARQLIESGRLLAIAHRGASAVAPENTLPAFQAALQIGGAADGSDRVDLVELDCRESADGVPLVFHDERLDRTTDWRRHAALAPSDRLDHWTAEQLSALDAGGCFQPAFAGAGFPRSPRPWS